MRKGTAVVHGGQIRANELDDELRGMTQGVDAWQYVLLPQSERHWLLSIDFTTAMMPKPSNREERFLARGQVSAHLITHKQNRCVVYAQLLWLSKSLAVARAGCKEPASYFMPGSAISFRLQLAIVCYRLVKGDDQGHKGYQTGADNQRKRARAFRLHASSWFSLSLLVVVDCVIRDRTVNCEGGSEITDVREKGGAIVTFEVCKMGVAEGHCLNSCGDPGHQNCQWSSRGVGSCLTTLACVTIDREALWELDIYTNARSPCSIKEWKLLLGLVSIMLSDLSKIRSCLMAHR